MRELSNGDHSGRPPHPLRGALTSDDHFSVPQHLQENQRSNDPGAGEAHYARLWGGVRRAVR